MDMKRFFLYFITIAALVLAGCGGGGNRMTKGNNPCDKGYERPSPGADCMKIVDGGGTAGMFASFLNATPMQAAMAIVADPMDPLPLDGDEDRPRPNSPRNTAGELDFTEDGTPPLTLKVDNDREVTVTEGTNPFIASEADIADLGEGWYGDAQMRTVNNQVDMVVTYNNAEDLGPLAWTAYYSSGAGRDGVTTAAADPTSGVVTLMHQNADEIETLLGLLGGAVLGAFPSADSQTYTFEADPDGDDTTEDDNRMIAMSTFNGIPGTVACSSNECTVVTDGDEEITSITGTWTFTPTVAMGSMLSEVMVPGVDPDQDYLYFGYWVQATGDDDNPYGISTFASGSQPFTGADDTFVEDDISMLMGSAEYNGSATGMFVKKTDGAPSHAGQFSAMTTLRANFGATDENMINVNDAYTISGTVHTFKGDGVGDWTVDLMEARFTTPTYSSMSRDVATHADYSATFNGETTGGGGWRGEFFGNPERADTPVEASEYPTGVAGEFDAHLDDGHVIGAFGAER